MRDRGELLPVPGRTGTLSRTADDLLGNVVCTVQRAGCWLPVPADWRLSGHAPPSYVALLCTGGSGEYRIGESICPMRPGTLLLCPPGVWREGRHLPADPLNLYAVHFHARLYGVLDVSTVYPLPVAFHPSKPVFDRLLAAARRVVDEIERAAPGHVLAADGACMDLLAVLWRETVASQDLPRVAGAAIARLLPVFRLIEERYAEPLTLRRLAAAVGLGPAYFSGFFKRAVGMPPMRFLARYRIDRVRELLAGTDLPLAAIADRTGFSDPGYLSRVFRASEGMPPGEYRRTQRSPMVS